MNTRKLAMSRVLQAMGELLASGGKIFWVAPSGGRDRPGSSTTISCVKGVV